MPRYDPIWQGFVDRRQRSRDPREQFRGAPARKRLAPRRPASARGRGPSPRILRAKARALRRAVASLRDAAASRRVAHRRRAFIWGVRLVRGRRCGDWTPRRAPWDRGGDGPHAARSFRARASSARCRRPRQRRDRGIAACKARRIRAHSGGETYSVSGVLERLLQKDGLVGDDIAHERELRVTALRRETVSRTVSLEDLPLHH